jgi:hypothetical protein
LRPERKEDMDVEPDQFGSQVGQSLRLSLRPPVFDENVPALDISKITHPLPESRAGWRGTGRQVTDPRNLGRLLRACP